MIGKTLSHYRIIERLGEGGMGVVYLAEDTVLGRRVAIKMLTNTTGPGNQHLRTRFLREARAVSALSHPHIAAIHDYGETDDGQPYIVMEYVRGETLGDLMLKQALTIPRSLEIIKEVAEALAEAHRHGIIHRDIKPSNVAIDHRGEVKVLDFGLAKQIDLGPADPERQTLVNTQTREGVIVGTPMYLSPEQALGVEVDARSDLFSLGGLLYECIAGKPPFFGGSPMEICAKVIRDNPVPPSQLNADVPKDLDRVVLKALHKSSDGRYQAADEMIADLNSVQAGLRDSGPAVTRLISPAAGTRPSGALSTLSDIFKRPRLSVGYVAAGLLIGVVSVAVVLWLNQGSLHTPSPEAKRFFDDGVRGLHEGTYHKASKMLERAVDADDKFALAHARLAEAYTELDYSDKAKDELLAVSRLVTARSMLDSTDALYVDAIRATVTRDLPGAISAYTEIAEAKSSEAHAYVDLGRAYENYDEVDKAIEQYSKASKLDRNNPAPFLRLAVLYGRRQDLPNSLGAFDTAEGLYQDRQNFEGSAEVSYQRGYLLTQMSKIPEARQAAQHSLEIAKLSDNNHQQVRALLLLSTIAYSSGDTAQAQPLTTQALELARANNMENLATQGLLDLGNSFLLRRAFDDAERYVRQALDLAQRYRRERDAARANLLLGAIYTQKEDAEKGAPFIDRALTFYRRGDYRREVSRCMVMIGRQQLLRGDFDGALKTLDDQLQLARQVEDPGHLARSQAEVAAALSKQDFYPQALTRYTESYELNKQLKNPLNAAFALLNRGDMLARLGRYHEANTALDELLPFLDRLSNENVYKNIWSAWTYLIRGRMALSERLYSEARIHCEQALRVLAEKDQSALAEVTSTIGLIEVYSKNVALGIKQSERAVAIAIATKNERLIANVRLTLAEVQLEKGNEEGALTTAIQAQESLAKLREEEFLWRACLIGALAHERLGDTDKMREQLASARAALAKLKDKWGADSFQSYAARMDIQTYLKQLSSAP